jgi:hypothetical protein
LQAVNVPCRHRFVINNSRAAAADGLSGAALLALMPVGASARRRRVRAGPAKGADEMHAVAIEGTRYVFPDLKRLLA